ncbi:MAG: hypothetical protein ACLP9S_03920 [Syntrophales bacterium]|jgi:exoribonuclease II
MGPTDKEHRSLLRGIARRAMIEKGLLSDFSDYAPADLAGMQTPAVIDDEKVRDLRDILWASIDNDDTRDIDQLTAAQAMPGDEIKDLVAVADVDAMVRNGSAIFRPRAAQHHVRIHRCRNIPDASRKAFHRSHIVSL